MTKEEKIELRREVCTRMLYGLKALATHSNQVVEILRGGCYDGEKYYFIPSILGLAFEIEDFKIYLRPMSSMTEEEEEELECKFPHLSLNGDDIYGYLARGEIGDFLEFIYSHHIDLNGLIPMGLALEVPEGMYKF